MLTRITLTGLGLLATTGCGHMGNRRAVPPAPPSERGPAQFNVQPSEPSAGFGGMSPGAGATPTADPYSPGGRYGTGAGGAGGGMPMPEPPPTLGGSAGAPGDPVDPPPGR